tara:strand:+ start:2116 stop:2901 length:786 start_codon:yes stop_codon:yes gene_type:complete
MFKDITLGTVWVGEVINTGDPLQLGRVKIKIFGKYDELEEDVIPWAIPYNQLASGTVYIPKIGEICNVFFENGDENIPFYTGIAKTNDSFFAEQGEDYPKVWSIVYDKRMGEDGLGEETDPRTLEIFYTETQGLIVRKNESFIQFSNEDESILINNTTGAQKILLNDDGILISNETSGKVISIKEDGISLGTDVASLEPAVLGDTLELLLNELIDEIGLLAIPTPAGPAPVSGAPTWANVEGIKSKWVDFKSLLVTLDKDK